MGKTIFTAKQSDFLELAQAQASITAEFYFRHRLSEDIDLFSEKEVNFKAIESFLQKISVKLGISKSVPYRTLEASSDTTPVDTHQSQ